MKGTVYPAYKLSGIGWLGNVPKHWEIKRLKTSARCWVSNVDKIPSDDELPVRLCNYTDVYYNDHIRPDMGLMETTATAEEIQRFSLRVDDVLITKDSEEWSDIAVPARVVATSDDLVCGYHLAIIRAESEKLFGQYLFRLFQSCAVNQQFQIAASGVTRYGLPKSSIGDAWIPLPSMNEQRAIADFLDRETAKLDTLVGKKRALIKKLKEKRAALISRTVTRGLPPAAARAAGLNPHPKLKLSGVEWLGEVPEHWEVMRGRFCMQVNPASDMLRKLKDDDEVSFVPMEAVGEDGSLALDVARAKGEISGTYTEFQDGDVVVAKITPCFENGKGALASGLMNGAALGTTELHVLRARSSLERGFLFYLTVSSIYRKTGEAEMYGAGGQKRVPPEFNKNFRIPLPPVSEQRAIADYLDRETTQIDRLIEKVEAAIERLREYRSALITSAVTGKIDVRGFAPQTV